MIESLDKNESANKISRPGTVAVTSWLIESAES